jgi:phage terminase large subunit
MSDSELVVRFPKIFAPLDKPYRYKVMWGGRGSAKSWSVARKLLLRGVDKPLRILCTRELQKSIKQSVHKLLKDQIEIMGLSGFYDIKDNGIKGLNGTEFIFLGVKLNTEEIKSTEGVDICWIEEGHNLTEASWDIIDPTIRKEGSEIWITYNTRFKFDHLHKTFVVDEPPPDSWVQMINHSDNPWLTEPLRRQMETMKARDHEKYLHIWEGQLKQLAEGAVFGKQITEVKKSGRYLYIPIQKNCEVFTFSDLGKKDETAIWFMQRVGMEYRFIDYFQGRLEEVEYYTRFIKATGYLYGTHYMPHDADHDRLGMKRNIKEQFEDGGISPIEIVERISEKNTAIQMARDIFPNCWFHKGRDTGNDEDCEGYIDWLPEGLNTRAKRAEKGFEALCNYRYKYNEDDDVYQKNPHHDWASNGADAFQQFAQSYETDDDNDIDLPKPVPTSNGWMRS